MIWAIVLLLVACGGAHDDDLFPDRSEPDPGWCCDGVCGLTAEEADEFTECVCNAPVRRPEAPGKGECSAQ